MPNEPVPTSCEHRLKGLRMLEQLQEIGPDVLDMDEKRKIKPDRTMEPFLLVQQHFGAMGPQPPRETFTEEDPPIPIKSIDLDHGPIPIDKLLGVYLPESREIEIFTKTIDTVASAIRAYPRVLEWIVRVHELGHALVHLGLSQVPEDWDSFLGDRISLVSAIDSGAHEVLAELVAWSLIKDDEESRTAFLNLMEKSPEEYKLSEEERKLDAGQVAQLIHLVRQDFEQHPEEFILGKYEQMREATRLLPGIVRASS